MNTGFPVNVKVDIDEYDLQKFGLIIFGAVILLVVLLRIKF